MATLTETRCGPTMLNRFMPPPWLTDRGLSLDREAEGDLPELEQLYITLRWPEFALLAMPDEGKRTLLGLQFQAQRSQYRARYPQVLFLIVRIGAAPVGRLYLGEAEGDIHVLDIALLAELRNRGLGRALLAAVIDQARAAGGGVRLHVDKSNPAQRLYQRLGFAVSDDLGYAWGMHLGIEA